MQSRLSFIPCAYFLLVCNTSLSIAKSPLENPSYYREARSYSTKRDPDIPKFAKDGSDFSWAPDWLIFGLDYRLRYEFRDDDIRRKRAGDDHPILHRTRAYFGIKDLADPFRFAVEVGDARRANSQFPQDNRDVNEWEISRAYAELYFKNALGYDPKGQARPLSLRYGIHNFEFLDRRLLGNNQWRNNPNTFQGFHASLGEDQNDWKMDLLAIQPRLRDESNFDQKDNRWLYGLIGHWRRHPNVTLEPYYLALHQLDTNSTNSRLVHNPGLRLHGLIGQSGFDYDASLNAQFGYDGKSEVEAHAATLEIGYTFEHPWKPRISAFAGLATGDDDPLDLENNRFERFYGFARPWSASDYIVYENIRSVKWRTELQPHADWRLDVGYSFYWLDSATDQFANANNARDRQGNSGNHVGQEFDLRVRYAINSNNDLKLGYSHFQAGDFIANTVRPGDSDFFYLEYIHRFF